MRCRCSLRPTKPASAPVLLLARGEREQARLGGCARAFRLAPAGDLRLELGIAPLQLAVQPADLQMRLHARDHLLGAGRASGCNRPRRRAKPRTTLSVSCRAVMKSTGTSCAGVAARWRHAFSARQTAKPSWPGIITSSRIRSGRARAAIFSACAPSEAVEDFVAARLQRLAQQREIRGRVVDDEDAFAAHAA